MDLWAHKPIDPCADEPMVGPRDFYGGSLEPYWSLLGSLRRCSVPFWSLQVPLPYLVPVGAYLVPTGTYQKKL